MNDIGKLKKKYTKIKDDINKYSYHYYVLDNPIISDSEFDILFNNYLKNVVVMLVGTFIGAEQLEI